MNKKAGEWKIEVGDWRAGGGSGEGELRLQSDVRETIVRRKRDRRMECRRMKSKRETESVRRKAR